MLDKVLKIFRQPLKAKNYLLYKLSNTYPCLFSDKCYLKSLYYLIFGETLNLKNPKTFNEKIQWLKLYNRKREYVNLVDKIKVKDYVAGIIGKQYIIPTLGIWEKFDDIDFSTLPDKFVLKCNHDSGNVVICRDKLKFDIDNAKKIIINSLKEDYYLRGREWPYKEVKRRIFIEEFLEDGTNEDMVDFKFFCFNGIPKFCQVIRNRHKGETIDFYDMDWKLQNFVGLTPGINNSTDMIEKPRNFEEMRTIAEKISKGHPFIRVDLYNISGRIFFGEITFYPASGFGRFTPEIFNYKIGNLIELDK